MATSTVASLPRLCRKGVERFVRHSPRRTLPLPLDQTVAEIVAIAEYNFRSGRFDYVKYHRLTQQKLTPNRYMQLLIEHWATEYPRVQRLNDCDSAELEKLDWDLTRAAGRMLRRVQPHSAVKDAEDFAVEAERRILDSSYPFDVAFDLWAQTILRHLILGVLRSSDVLDKPHVSLDAPRRAVDPLGDNWHEAVPDPSSENILVAMEDRARLLSLIKKLRNPRYQEVIVMKYFEGRDDAAIARCLGTTTANVRTLRSRALELVRQFAGQKRVNGKQRRKHQSE